MHAFASPRMFVVFLLGFSSGLPIALTATTLQAWMTADQIDLSVIGAFSLVGIPYTTKFLWAPLLDRYSLPFFGRRRGWILLMQVLIFFSVFLMSMIEPQHSLGLLAAISILIAFFSATQDIVIDAYRTEILLPEEYGIGAGVTTLGYRLAATVLAGAVALILADHMPWPQVYRIMALAMGVGILGTFLAKNPMHPPDTPRTLKEAVINPLKEFLSRRGIFEIFSFVLLYKLDAVLTLALMTYFLLKLGFTNTEVGVVTKGVGLFATLSGTLIGGIFVLRWRLLKSLWTFGILQATAGISFWMLAHFGKSHALLVAAIFTENFCSGLGNAAYSALLMSLCDKRYTAFQFALLSSIMALTRILVSSPSGWMAKELGWEGYYILCILAGLPGLLLLTRFRKWSISGQ